MKLRLFRKQISVLVLILLFFGQNVSAQSKDRSGYSKIPFKERFSVGGSLGLSFGNSSTFIEVSPMLGVAISETFAVGMGLTYKFYMYRDYYKQIDKDVFYDHKTNIFGGSVWARYFLTKLEIPVIENTFLHAEVEPLVFQNNFKYVSPGMGDYRDVYGNYYTQERNQVTLTGVFLGGGLRQMLGSRSYLYLEVLWNFNEDLYSPYSNPRVRVGISAGF
ncbi:MAG: hypothetical protein R2764_15415 [Bacteroidales bacterium]